MKVESLENEYIVLKPYSTNDMEYVINLHRNAKSSVFDDIERPSDFNKFKDRVNNALNIDTVGWICWSKKFVLRFGIIYFSNVIPKINALFHPIADMRGYKEYLKREFKPIKLMDLGSKLAIKYMFEKFQLQRISGAFFIHNISVINLCKRIGFKNEGIIRRGTCYNNKAVDINMLGLLPEEVIL